MRRALVIAHAPVGAALAGPAIRSAAFARALLGAGFEVTLAGERGAGEPDVGVPFLPYARHAPRALRDAIASADVVVTQPPWPGVAAWIRASDARAIVDLYDPEPLEALEFLRTQRRAVRRTVTALSLDRVLNALHDGHVFLCASERQRDLWTGTLLAQRLLTPTLHDSEPGLPGLFGVVPFGVDDEPPRAGPGPRERFPQLSETDEIVLWNGGLWAWLDPETALRAVALLAERRPSVRLVFMGASADAQARAAAESTRRVAGELGILDTVALFNDAWVPHAERGGWLLQADCAVSTHADHLETRYAFRTRLLDCFWAGLPVVCTEGDDLAAMVERDGLGATVAAGDVEGLAAALESVLDRGRDSFSASLAGAADQLRWSGVCEPLVELASVSGPSASLGSRSGRRRPSSPALRARDLAYRGASSALGALRLGDRVRLR